MLDWLRDDTLEQRDLNACAERALALEPPAAPGDLDALEARVDRAVEALRAKRRELARERGGWTALVERLDRAILTDEIEHLDDPDFPAEVKQRLLRSLHQFNLALGSYRRFVGLLAPAVRDVAARTGRPARLLELASGSGELALELARIAHARGLPVEVTGSDYVPEHVEVARRHAERRRLPARFRVVNAFHMEELEDGEYDLVLIAQTMHHFSPGRLARMIAASSRVATTRFVGIDGRRALDVMAFLAVTSPLRLRRAAIHDAVTTARKLYPAHELELVARLAAPTARVVVRPISFPPTHTILTIEFTS